MICLGYPLCGGGHRPRMRDEVLLTLTTPALFVQGTRDNLCPLDLFEDVRSGMSGPTSLHVVNGGDHSLVVSKTELKARRSTQADIDREIAGALTDFIRDDVLVTYRS